MHDSSEWRGNAWGMNPDLDEMPQLYEALLSESPVCSLHYNLKGIKGLISFFLSFPLSFTSLFTVAYFMA